MSNIPKIEKLLSWMQENLNSKSSFTAAQVASFFADHFVIKTNSRTIEATPATYRDYLYQLKSKLNGVSYELEEFLESGSSVVIPFIIQMDFIDKPRQRLQAISIFSFDQQGRITEWKEVFANVSEQEFSYDP